MRWSILRPAAAIVGWAIAALLLAAAVLGCLRFFLLVGASPAYVLRRKRWYEGAMLGRRMRARDLLAFGRWVAWGNPTGRQPR